MAERGSVLGRYYKEQQTNTKSINPYQRNYQGLHEKRDAEVKKKNKNKKPTNKPKPNSPCPPAKAREAVDK